jgi:hypothetical protein
LVPTFFLCAGIIGESYLKERKGHENDSDVSDGIWLLKKKKGNSKPIYVLLGEITTVGR